MSGCNASGNRGVKKNMKNSRKEQFPSPTASNLLYNATSVPDWGRFEIVKSRESVPELALREAIDAAEDLAKCLNEHFIANGVPQLDVFGDSRYGDDIARFAGWIQDEPIDRTVETPLIDPLIYTPEVVVHLQRTFLVDWPLWRVQVVSMLPEPHAKEPRSHDMMIYSNVAWVGERRCPPEDLAGPMDAWRNFHFDYIERKKGPKRRQLLFARREGTRGFSESYGYAGCLCGCVR